MMRLILMTGILMLLTLPGVALAQYVDPPSNPTMGGSGGTTLPDISIGDRGETEEVGDVTIVDFAFQPAFMAVPAGSAVSWWNSGTAPHTVTARDGAFDSGEIGPGGGYSETFVEPGIYRYQCTIHPRMMGTILVSGT